MFKLLKFENFFLLLFDVFNKVVSPLVKKCPYSKRALTFQQSFKQQSRNITVQNNPVHVNCNYIQIFINADHV